MLSKRKARLWIIILSVPLVLLIGSAVALKLFLSRERLKAIIVPRLEEATGKTVTLKDISLSLFPPLVVNVDSLIVHNRKGRGFSARPFVSLDRLLLDVRLSALFKGSFEVATVILKRPRLSIEINEVGEANYSEGVRDTGDVAVSVSAERGRFLLSDFRIVEGYFEYVNRQENSEARIEGINQELRAEFIPVVNEMHVESKTRIEKLSLGSPAGPLISDIRITLDQTLLYEADKDILTVQKAEARLGDIVLAVKGQVTHVSSRPVLDVRIESVGASITNLLSILPGVYGTHAGGIQGKGNAQIQATVTGTLGGPEPPDIVGHISATGATIQYHAVPKPITEVNVVADLLRTKHEQSLRVTSLSARIGRNPLNATLSVVDFDDPSLSMKVRASVHLNELKDYYPLESGTDLVGTMEANVSVVGKVRDPATMKASGSLGFHQVSIGAPSGGRAIRNFTGTLAFDDQVLESRRLSFTLGNSDFSLGIRITNYLSFLSGDASPHRPAVTATISSRHLYADDLVSGTSATERGDGRAPEKKGTGVPLPGVSTAVSASIGTLTTRKFSLNNVNTVLSIRDGIVNVQNCTFEMFGGSASARGTLDLKRPDRPTFNVTMEMNRIEARDLLAQVSSFGEHIQGTLTMKTTMGGALDDTLGLVPAALEGKGTVEMRNGRLTGLSVTRSVSELLNVPDLREINFQDWANSFSIAGGRIVVKDLRISALDADYVVNGSQGVDGSLDYRMSLAFPPGPSANVKVPGFGEEAADLFRDESGRLRLDFSVTGTSDDPKVLLDTRAVQTKLEELAKRKLLEKARTLEEQVKQESGDMLRDLLKKKKK